MKASKEDKADVLERIGAGDSSAVADYLNRYGNLVWFLAKKYTSCVEDAEDAVQEIFMDIWQHADRFDREKSSETNFIALIARRRLIDRLRKTCRQPQFRVLEEAVEFSSVNSENRMQINLDAHHAMQIIDALRPAQRQVMNLAIFDGMTHSEIADRTGMPIGTVKTLIRRGFRKVRASFGVRQEQFA